MISQASVDKVARQIQDCLATGAQVVCGGRPICGSLFFEPTVLSNVAPGSVSAMFLFPMVSDSLSLACIANGF